VVPGERVGGRELDRLLVLRAADDVDAGQACGGREWRLISGRS